MSRQKPRTKAKAEPRKVRVTADPMPEISAAEMAKMRPAEDVVPELVAAWRRGRGRQKAPTKVAISLRVDADVLEGMKRTGSGWQTRANAALRTAFVTAKARPRPAARKGGTKPASRRKAGGG